MSLDGVDVCRWASRSDVYLTSEIFKSFRYRSHNCHFVAIGNISFLEGDRKDHSLTYECPESPDNIIALHGTTRPTTSNGISERSPALFYLLGFARTG